MPMLTAPHADPESWYNGSVSHGLRGLAAKGNPVLPADLYQAISDAAGKVYVHESRVNTLRLTTPRGKLIDPDPFFVFNGYREALNELMELIKLPENQLEPFRWKVCVGLSKLLHDMLSVLRAKGFDYARMYKNLKFKTLAEELENGLRLE
ncbi:hypothetical protein RhiJN_02410 [Ceratobasidium sp. AG-Ba]|nr:hypothetical protein RhiJN_02410 [Ceratobasidium sp. AG-Ba]QRW03333.1 hypothetical protein RhiLY_02332 [Ceratobasidium sp. AG-Ba]